MKHRVWAVVILSALLFAAAVGSVAATICIATIFNVSPVRCATNAECGCQVCECFELKGKCECK